MLIDNWLSGDKTGHDIGYQLKQNFTTANIPVILISATANLEDTAERCQAGGFIIKPFDIENLLGEVRKYLIVVPDHQKCLGLYAECQICANWPFG